MNRVEAASGARYTAHKEKARKFEPIAPVGTNYSPIGRPDMNELRRGAPKDVITPTVVSVCPPITLRRTNRRICGTGIRLRLREK